MGKEKNVAFAPQVPILKPFCLVRTKFSFANLALGHPRPYRGGVGRVSGQPVSS